jgi:hypothetical protein
MVEREQGYGVMAYKCKKRKAEVDRQWRLNNRERYNRRHREYRIENLEDVMAIEIKSRAKRRANARNNIRHHSPILVATPTATSNTLPDASGDTNHHHWAEA